MVSFLKVWGLWFDHSYQLSHLCYDDCGIPLSLLQYSPSSSLFFLPPSMTDLLSFFHMYLRIDGNGIPPSIGDRLRNLPLHIQVNDLCMRKKSSFPLCRRCRISPPIHLDPPSLIVLSFFERSRAVSIYEVGEG